MKYVMIAITLCILKALETCKNIDKQQTVSILVYSNLTVKHGQSHFASIIYRKGGKKLFHYIQEMSNALVLYWLDEKYH